jgi:hypothetical protein
MLIVPAPDRLDARRSSVRQFTFALLCGASLLCAACGKSPEANGQANAGDGPPLYKNVPGAVTGDRAAGINSSFRIIEAAGGIPSDRYGGACIVFRAADLGYPLMAAKQCTKDEDCATGEADAHYCQKSTKQCLARPNPTGDKDPYCNRSIDYGFPGKQWPADTDIAISQNPIPVPQNLKPGGEALLITLLKRKSPANAPPVTEIGTPTPIP